MNETALKARLKSIALEKNMPFNQIWKQLLLERFLARLSLSEYKEKFIFKGGLLLASYLDIGRETMDVDFSLKKLNAIAENIKTVMVKISAIQVADSLSFKWNKIETLAQPHMQYVGHRVFLHVNFGKLKDKIQIDIGIGDVVDPKEKIFPTLKYKGQPIFNNEIKLLMYPAEAIFAEKLETIISKGDINSRMKDYHDLLLMARNRSLLDLQYLNEIIHKTFTYRNTPLQFPISFNSEGLQTLQKLWDNHISGLGIHKNRLNLPASLREVIEEVNAYLAKILPNS